VYALFYRHITEPEIVYDIDAGKVLHGQVQQIKVLSTTRCLLDGVPYALQPLPRWRTLRGQRNSTTDNNSSYNIFCAEYASSNFKAMRDAPWLETSAEIDLAMQSNSDFFLLLEKSRFIDSFSGKLFYNDSNFFDLPAYARRAKFFSDPFGMLVAFGATTFAPNLVQTKEGKFLSDPLALALWTTMQVGGALFSQALGKVYYNAPDSGHFKRFGGVGLLLPRLDNYGHWHVQNLPALFGLKQLLDRGLFAVEDVTVVATQPENANVDLLEHYLQLLNIRPRLYDPTKDGTGAFAFDCTLLPSSCSVGAFQWSPFVAESLSLLRESAASRDRVLFISRTDVGNARGLINENDVLQALIDAGIPVERVVAGKMRYDQQRHLFGQAKLVIGTHGGGLTNAIYGGPQCAVLELICDVSDNNRGWYHNLFHLLGQRYAAISCPSLETAWSAPFRARPELVVTATKALLSPQ
jgi:Glycosyltransferase 61